MNKQEFDFKIKTAETKLKQENHHAFCFSKKLAATIAAFAMAASMVFGFAACGPQNTPTPVGPNPPIVKPDDPNPPKPIEDDKDKEKEEAAKKLAAAIETANGFIAGMQEKQNFTNTQGGVTYEYANGATKVHSGNETLYYHNKENVSYKVYNDGEAWREMEAENTRDIADALVIFNQMTWEKLSGDNLMGSKTLDGKTLALSVKVANGTADYTYSLGGIATSGTISKVGTTSFQIPEVEAETPPPIEEIDWDNLTASQLAEFTPVMVENIKTTLAKNIQRTIGNGSTLNNIFAIDFDGNNLILGLNYTSDFDKLGLFSYELTKEANYKDLYENNFAHITTRVAGTQLIDFRYDNCATDNMAKIQQCFTKLANDGLVNYTGDEDFLHMITGGTGPDTTLHCGATDINLYKIDKNSLKYITLSVRSDGNTQDFIKDYLLNGTLNKTYRKLSQEFEYNFTNKALYNFTGLESTTLQENQN